MWTTPDIDEGFVAPLAREVCWPVGFCATFGGETAEALTLSGWQYHRPADTAGLGALATAEGITVGSRWADHLTVITVEPGGCYTTGYGRTNDGIRLELLGGTWSRTDDDGGYVALLPDPASVEIEVDAMAAGELVNHLTYDC